MAEENKMTDEMAEKEFLSWCEENELETDVSSMSEDQATVFESAKKKFMSLLKKGRLVVDAECFDMTLSKFGAEGVAGTTIHVGHPDGKLWIGMDGKKDTEKMHKTQQAISALIGKDVGWISKMDAKDWGFLSQVVALFLV